MNASSGWRTISGGSSWAAASAGVSTMSSVNWISPTWRTFSTSPASSLGEPSNQASRISVSSASLVVRSDRASTFASFHLRAPLAVSASAHSAARTPATLLAAIDAPVPVQQQTTPCSARPSATSRAAASLAHAQSSRSPSAKAPCTIGS